MKFNELLANCAIYSTTLALTATANELSREGWSIEADDLATVTPYITSTIRRFGDWVLDLNPPHRGQRRAPRLRCGRIGATTWRRPASGAGSSGACGTSLAQSGDQVDGGDDGDDAPGDGRHGLQQRGALRRAGGVTDVACGRRLQRYQL